jgi:hypothetical protein
MLLHHVIFRTPCGNAPTDFNVLYIQELMLNTGCENVWLVQHWFLMSACSHVDRLFSN